MEAFWGGLIGAALAGAVAMYVARKDREHADRGRYYPERNALYREFLKLCNDYVIEVKEQVELGRRVTMGYLSPEKVPQAPDHAEIRRKLAEVEDVFPVNSLSAIVAGTLYSQVRMLSIFSRTPEGEPIDAESDAFWSEGLESYEAWREFARGIYQKETGGVPPDSRIQTPTRWKQPRRVRPEAHAPEESEAPDGAQPSTESKTDALG